MIGCSENNKTILYEYVTFPNYYQCSHQPVNVCDITDKAHLIKNRRLEYSSTLVARPYIYALLNDVISSCRQVN